MALSTFIVSFSPLRFINVSRLQLDKFTIKVRILGELKQSRILYYSELLKFAGLKIVAKKSIIISFRPNFSLMISGMSKRTFERRFKIATGDSPIQYIQKLRVEVAKEQLETTNQSFEEISYHWDI